MNSRFEEILNNEFTFDTEENFNMNRRTLNQIFDVEPLKSAKTDESLRYVPVYPEAVEHSMPWKTRLVKIVVGFKNREAMGRVVVAILSSLENINRILIYKNRGSPLATLTVLDGEVIPHMIRQNCYWQFYDNVGVYWSLQFERSTDELEFISTLKECRIRTQLDLDVNSDIIGSAEELIKLKLLNQPSKKFENLTITSKLNEETSIPSADRSNFKVSSAANAKLMQGTNDFNENNETETIDRCTSLTVIGQPMYTTDSKIQKQYLLPITQSNMMDKASCSSVFNPVEAHVMQLLLVENRTQNTELRINMDKLESRIEKVIDKIEVLHANSEHDDEVIKLEEKILALKKENRRLKSEGKNVTAKIGPSHQNIYSIYENELTNLGIYINPNGSPDMDPIVGELIDRVMSLQTQLQSKEMQLKDLSIALRDQKECNEQEKLLHIELKDKLDQAEHKIKILQTSLDKKKENEAQLSSLFNEINSQHTAHLNNVKLEMTETLKDIMNSLYRKLAENIVSMEKLLPDKLLPLIGKTIRQDTLSAITKITK